MPSSPIDGHGARPLTAGRVSSPGYISSWTGWSVTSGLVSCPASSGPPSICWQASPGPVGEHDQHHPADEEKGPPVSPSPAVTRRGLTWTPCWTEGRATPRAPAKAPSGAVAGPSSCDSRYRLPPVAPCRGYCVRYCISVLAGPSEHWLLQ